MGEKKGKKAKPKPKPLPGKDTPEGDELRKAKQAFDAGDHIAVRAITRELESAEDPEVRAAAARMAQWVAIDPIQVVVLACCAALLFTIVYLWVL